MTRFRLLVYVGALALAGAFVVLVLRLASIPEWQLRDLGAFGYPARECWLLGTRIERIESLDGPVRFRVADEDGAGLDVELRWNMRVPDNFRNGVRVHLRGRYDSVRRLFVASEVWTISHSRDRLRVALPSGPSPTQDAHLFQARDRGVASEETRNPGRQEAANDNLFSTPVGAGPTDLASTGVGRVDGSGP
jgi:hypothetical protein